MEHKTDFELISALENWKLQFVQNENFSADDISELESHLRDEITELKDLGLSEEESFLIAQKRMGSIAEITPEFTKVNAKEYFKNKILTAIKGILIVFAFLNITGLITVGGWLLINKSELDDTSFYTAIVAIPTVLTLLVLFFLINKYRNEKLYIFESKKTIPVAAGVIILTYALSILSSRYLFFDRQFDYAMLSVGYNWFKTGLILLFLLWATVVNFVSDRKKKMKFA